MYDCEDYDAWLDRALSLHADCLCDSLLGWPFFDRAVRDPRAEVSASGRDDAGNPRPVSITWRDGNRWAWLHSAESWGQPATAETLLAIKRAADLLGVPPCLSPAGLGQKSMIAHLGDANAQGVDGLGEDIRRGQPGRPDGLPGAPALDHRSRNPGGPRYLTPAVAVADDLRRHSTGGRAELRKPYAADTAYEIDRRMAFVAECLHPLPIGPAVRLSEGELDSMGSEDRLPAYFVRCVVVVPRQLSVGPFPVRSPHGAVSYPTRPGTYEDVRLWREEIEATRAAGCIVVVRDGWGWRWTEPVLAGWAHAIHAAREHAPDEMTADCIKLIAVAAIGWFAMAPTRLLVRPAEEFPDLSPLPDRGGRPTRYTVVAVDDPRPRGMPHWSSAIWMRSRLSLYERQCAEVANGNTVRSSNFDSLVLGSCSTLDLQPHRLGGWRAEVLTNVVQNHPRQLVCDQRLSLPGVPGEHARAYAEAVRAVAVREREEHPRRSAGNGFAEGWAAMEGEEGGRRLGGPRRRPREPG